MRCEPIGVSIFLQIAADYRLRLIPLRDLHRFDIFVAAHPGVIADKVDEVAALQQQLGHDRVVVVIAADMAITAGLGLGGALGMRVMWRERLR